MMDENQAQDMAVRAVEAMRRDDTAAAMEVTDVLFQENSRAWDAYLVARAMALMVKAPAVPGDDSGVWSPNIGTGDHLGRIFALQFTAALLNGDEPSAQALFGAEFMALDSDGGPERFAQAFAAVIALAAVWGEKQ